MKRIIKQKQGFTLLELLVVMAISVVLLGLIMYPLYQSFSMTRRAEAMVDAQDSARSMMAQITRDIGQAIFVFDNTSTPITLPVRKLDGSVDITKFTIPFGKIDIQMPKMVAHCKNPDGHTNGEPRDFNRDDGNGNVYAQPECPVCGSTNVEIRPKLPLQQDTKIVRYFLGLKFNDAALGWRSPEKDNLSPGDDNPVILYRAEFDPRDDSLFPAAMSVSDRLNDPDFFYRTEFAERWAQLAKPIGIARYQDLVSGTYDINSNIIAVAPTVSFKFAKIDNDNMSGTYTTDKSFDYPNAVPTVYRATQGYWAPGSSVTVIRDLNTAYTLTVPTNPTDHWIIKKQVYTSSWSAPVDMFDITDYAQNGIVVSMDGSPLEMAFTLNMNKGIVDFGIYPQKVDVNDNSISPLDPVILNSNFKNTYATDEGSAQRGSYLTTFDSSMPNYLKNARIVPGSEVVVGPDYYDGTHTKSRRYERVPYNTGYPGPNQYKIDYDAGEILFSPVPEQNIPDWELIDIDYKVYFNGVNDVVSGNYTTKALITVQLGIRVFDPESSKPHLITISDNVVVGNALR